MEVVRLFIDEIAILLDERRILGNEIRKAGKRAAAVGLSPKVLREVIRLRMADAQERRKEMTLLALCEAADGWGETKETKT